MIDEKVLKQISKWTIITVSILFLIYLSVRYMNEIFSVIGILLNIFKPLFIGVVIAIILNLPLKFIETKLMKKTNRYSRLLSIIGSLIITIGFVLFIPSMIIPELIEAFTLFVDISQNFIREISSNSSIINNIEIFNKISIDWNSLITTILDWAENTKDIWTNGIITSIKSAVDITVDLCIGLVFAVYILGTKEKLLFHINMISEAWIPIHIKEKIKHVIIVFKETFENFLLGQTTEAIILGVLCAIGMLILRIPYPATVGVLVGVTALIPYIGAFIGMFVGALLIFVISPLKALIFIIYLTILQQIEGNVIYPKNVGSKISLPPIWTFAAIVIGGNIAGPLGMIASVPICGALYQLFKEVTIFKLKGIKQ